MNISGVGEAYLDFHCVSVLRPLPNLQSLQITQERYVIGNYLQTLHKLNSDLNGHASASPTCKRQHAHTYTLIFYNTWKKTRQVKVKDKLNSWNLVDTLMTKL